MREPTSDEMIKGIAEGVQKFLSHGYGSVYTSLQEDFRKGVSVGVGTWFLEQYPCLTSKGDLLLKDAIKSGVEEFLNKNKESILSSVKS